MKLVSNILNRIHIHVIRLKIIQNISYLNIKSDSNFVSDNVCQVLHYKHKIFIIKVTDNYVESSDFEIYNKCVKYQYKILIEFEFIEKSALKFINVSIKKMQIKK